MNDAVTTSYLPKKQKKIVEKQMFQNVNNLEKKDSSDCLVFQTVLWEI